MKLYGYFRSSAAYRVRIALALKGLEYEQSPIHLRHNEQRNPDFTALNPAGLVPVLQDGPHVLTQSLAIIQYLDETHPTPPLLPADPVGRARVRALALTVACEIHPLNNLRVLRYLVGLLGITSEAKDDWYRYWVAEGFEALEQMLAGNPATGRFCHGDTPTLADICLVPQVVNAKRFNCDLEPYPEIRRIAETCRAVPAFAAADPARQPDYEEGR